VRPRCHFPGRTQAIILELGELARSRLTRGYGWRAGQAGRDSIAYEEIIAALMEFGYDDRSTANLKVFGGERFWFRCPTCDGRTASIFIVGPPAAKPVPSKAVACGTRLPSTIPIIEGKTDSARFGEASKRYFLHRRRSESFVARSAFSDIVHAELGAPIALNRFTNRGTFPPQTGNAALKSAGGRSVHAMFLSY
jgi:hypothetical protein